MLDTIAETRVNLSRELKAYACKCTGQEKVEIALLNNIGVTTVYKYCRGFVGCVPIAEKILADLKRYVAKRESVSAA